MRYFSLALIASIAVGCGPPVMYDVDGQPIREPLFMAALEGGWLAVDSSAAGVRAVLELEVAASGERETLAGPGELQLWTGSGLPLEPARLRQGEVECWPKLPSSVRCREGRGSNQACVQEVQGVGRECRYTLCAEFRLAELPRSHDPLVVNIGGSLTILQLRR
ncbi:MAG: hypothetical protein JSU87_00745 [Gemmatimonadota bacterium]|nr:MAG: hypothetical protein JSU87_00745 [Gemmatimonadota bacterium]